MQQTMVDVVLEVSIEPAQWQPNRIAAPRVPQPDKHADARTAAVLGTARCRPGPRGVLARPLVV